MKENLEKIEKNILEEIVIVWMIWEIKRFLERNNFIEVL